MKRLVSVMLTIILLTTLAVPLAFAEEKTGVELADNVKSAILIERDTGKVLYEKNSNESVAASKYDENHDDAFNYGSIG